MQYMLGKVIDNKTKLVLYNHNTDKNEQLAVIKGMFGVKKILDIHYGKDGGGIDMYGYLVKYKDGTQLIINNPCYASDLS